MYKPSGNYNVPVKLLVPVWTTIKGVSKKTFPDDGDLIFCSFKSYGGTQAIVNAENNVNGILSIIDTAQVETWFRPDIKSDCAIKLESGAIYEIIGETENIELRNQTLKFKVRRVKGKA